MKSNDCGIAFGRISKVRGLHWVGALFFGITLLTPAAADGAVTHAGIIGGWNVASLSRGAQIYGTICVTCHGTPDAPGTLPTSRLFWKEPFKNGADPLSMYKTIRDGFGQMPSWPGLDAQASYDVIHYLREEFLKKHNPEAYFKVTGAYLAGLPSDPLPEASELAKIPPYLRMDFGPSLNWTYEVAPGNIAYKGIAVRLDAGLGGVSKGRSWMLYDHDTMRVATAWTGERFVDWKGIAFDGSHQTHTSVVGEKLFINPVGPGWANPCTGSFDDPRFRGRDGRPYGPLPRDWTQFKGIYRHENRTILAYRVGETEVLESPGLRTNGSQMVFSRTLNVGRSAQDLLMRVAPESCAVSMEGEGGQVSLEVRAGFKVVRVAAGAARTKFRVEIGTEESSREAVEDLEPMLKGAAPRWDFPMITKGQMGSETGAFAVDTIAHPDDERNPWQSWMRLGGFDFFADGKRAAVCTWLGEVWLVTGIDGDLSRVSWKRIAAGLFQPLGLKIVDETIYVTCRDQIARLHDLNGDDEIDFYENFNNDHQVTEHFHEFAMGLQTDAAGNFYYAKSARHALPALVPHHGTLLRVSKDGARTEIIANGFRAANGVCVNEDGTFFVTDQEGHWIPKNRINWVKRGGFYGNFMGYHDRTNSADSEMEQPVVWITNEMDRSPGEIVRVTSDPWGPLKGGLLNLSYGTGRIYLVPHETVNDRMQGGVVALPIPELPTGLMRGRFHQANGQLYGCGLFAWAGNRTADGGFYRIRYTGKPMHLPAGLQARSKTLVIRFTDPLDKSEAERIGNYTLKRWSLKRSAQYGSKHYDETRLEVAGAALSADQRTIRLTVPELEPTWCMEVAYRLRGTNGEEVQQKLHSTIHEIPRE